MQRSICIIAPEIDFVKSGAGQSNAWARALKLCQCSGGPMPTDKKTGGHWVYTPWITVRGRRIYASSVGKKVFRFWVDD